jgi:hypothetical protein
LSSILVVRFIEMCMRVGKCHRTNAAAPADARTFRDMGLEAAIFVCLRRERQLMAQSICACLGDAQVTVASVWTGEEGRGGGVDGGGALAYARVYAACVCWCAQDKLLVQSGLTY